MDLTKKKMKMKCLWNFFAKYFFRWKPFGQLKLINWNNFSPVCQILDYVGTYVKINAWIKNIYLQVYTVSNIYLSSSSRGIFPSALHSYSKRRFIRPFAPPCTLFTFSPVVVNWLEPGGQWEGASRPVRESLCREKAGWSGLKVVGKKNF